MRYSHLVLAYSCLIRDFDDHCELRFQSAGDDFAANTRVRRGSRAPLRPKGLELIRNLSSRCKIPVRLRDLNIPESAIPRMARSAMTVTRLFERNVREVTHEDAVEIYRRAL